MKGINKIQKVLFLIMLIVIVLIGLYAVYTIFVNKDKGNLKEEKTIKYGYKLYDRDSEYYKEIFNNLKTTLDSKDINYEDYAKYITELFVIDFYSLNNKTSKNDIGGLQYIELTFQENIKLNATNTIYKYINVNNKKELPEVTGVELIKIEQSTYKIDNVSYESYIVELSWEYKEDLDYENEGTFIVIKDDNKLYIVEKK